MPPTPALKSDEVRQYINTFLEQGELMDSLRNSGPTPLFVLDTPRLIDRAVEFRDSFRQSLPKSRFFYAMKSNNHPDIARALIAEGYGLDVSSGVELEAAIECGAREIVFSGPGKTDAELELAVKHVRRVTVLIDSFAELQRLDDIARKHDCGVRAGVRLTTQDNGIWRKFGIPLDRMPAFFEAAEACKHVWLCGIQFHLSWNLSPDNHVAFLTRLGRSLADLTPKYRSEIEFIDIGGGYWPPRGEWLQTAATRQGMLAAAIDPRNRPEIGHGKEPAAPLEVFVERIAHGIKTLLPPDIECEIFTEPGRWVCNDAMHIVLRVVDKKADDLVITDGGINMVGWERYEADYCPIINLSRPSLDEKECLIAGSLCTPHDIWGYSYFGKDIQAGDLLLIPDQGAYTYSLRQQFIKPLPAVIKRPEVEKRDHPQLKQTG